MYMVCVWWIFFVYFCSIGLVCFGWLVRFAAMSKPKDVKTVRINTSKISLGVFCCGSLLVPLIIRLSLIVFLIQRLMNGKLADLRVLNVEIDYN